MWPFLPKKCDCPETPNNQGTSCDHSGLTTNDLIYDGPNGVCSNIVTGMTATEVFQQLDYFICSIELTQYILNEIQNNIEEYPEFITLVNGAINCDTINNCGPRPITTTTSSSTSTTSSTSTSTSTTSTSTSSTTTTTTTVAEACYVYNLTATINNASWTAQLCSGGVTSGVLPFIGNTFTTPCIINTSLVLNGITAITNSIDCTPTTTTTSTSLTSTTSSTTSTTTIPPSTTTTTTTAVFSYCPNSILSPTTSYYWSGLTTTPDGTLYGCTSNGLVWKYPVGGPWSSVSVPTTINAAIAGDSLGNVYAARFNEGLYIKLFGNSYFQPFTSSLGFGPWTGLFVDQFDTLWALQFNGSIFTKAVSTTTFVYHGPSIGAARDITVAPNGDVYVCRADVMLKQTGGVGAFVPLPTNPGYWTSISAAPNGDIICVGEAGFTPTGGGIWVIYAGTDTFVKLSCDSNSDWSSVHAITGGKFYAGQSNSTEGDGQVHIFG